MLDKDVLETSQVDPGRDSFAQPVGVTSRPAGPHGFEGNYAAVSGLPEDDVEPPCYFEKKDARGDNTGEIIGLVELPKSASHMS